MLRKRILTQILVIQFVVLCLFVGAYGVIYQSYQDVEQQKLETNLQRVKAALNREITSLDKYTREWAGSGAIYYAIRNREPATLRIRDFYMASIVGAFGIDKAAIFDRDATLITAREIQGPQNEEATTDASSPFVQTLLKNPQLISHKNTQSGIKGLIQVGDDILVVSSQPITLGEFGPGVHGTLITATFFNKASLQELSDIVLQNLNIVPIDQATATSISETTYNQLRSTDAEALFAPIDEQTIGTYALLSDMEGNPSFLLAIQSQRKVMLQVQNTIANTGMGLFILFVCLSVLLLVFIDRSILKRLKLLSGEVNQLTDSRDIKQRLPMDGNDELSGLTGAFNSLLDSLQSIQNSLRSERDKAETTLASIGDAVITTDIQGRIEYLNKAARRITGTSLPQSEGRELSTLYNPVDDRGNSRGTDLACRCIQTGQTIHDTQYCFLTVDNQEVVIESQACPIVDEEGTINGAVIAFRDVTQARRLQRNLVYQASHDGLTNLYNRGEFERQLSIVAEAAQKNDQFHHLLFVDLDRFKVVNDSCGHMAGDQVLKEIAQLMQSTVRESDVLARIGGDEFGIILMDCRATDAFNIAEKIRGTIEGFRFVSNGKSFSFGASIGLVDLKDQAYDAESGVLSMADKACMAAKNAGRNRVHIFRREDTHLAEHHQHTQWVNRVTEALEHDKFTLYFQEVIPASDPNLPKTAEILLRMVDDDGNAISPGAFLPAAERYGLMKFIDKWVIEHFCQWAQENSHVFDIIPQFSINLSGQSLNDKKFLNYLLDFFEQSPIDPRHICFEITETAAIHKIQNVQHFITNLRMSGFSFSLDDFGSGMSSFGYLKHLPVDSLKIDGVFIKNIQDDPIDYSMVRSIHEIGQVLNMKTVAEFVENKTSRDMLVELGVDYLQGFYIHKPEPLDNLLRAEKSWPQTASQ